MAVLSTLSRLISLSRNAPEVWDWDERRTDYALWDAYYRNTVYDTVANGGWRQTILRDVLGIDCTDVSDDTDLPKLIGHYNPVAQIVDVYQNMLPGQYGVDIAVAEKVDGRDVHPVLLGPTDPLGKLWRQSNLDTEKQELQRDGANLGSTGIRVVSDTSNPEEPRVYLDFDHPSRIVDYEEDSRGNVTRVRLEYTQVMGFGKEARDVEVVEEFDQERFSRTYDGAEQLEGDDAVNTMGFCPYVIYRFKGTKGFGRPCHEGTLPIIDFVNWTITNQGESIYEHTWPTWFLTAAGPAPETIPLGKGKVMYVATTVDGPTPSADALVPQLDQAACLKFIEDRKREIRDRQPETAIGSTEALSGLSGESYARLMVAAKDLIMQRRANLQHALKRAIMMAFSYQIANRMADFGTGMGTREAADRAWNDGKLAFSFKDQPAVTPTAAEAVQQVDAELAPRTRKLANAATLQRLGLPLEEILREAGYDQKRIDELVKAAAEQPFNEENDL